MEDDITYKFKLKRKGYNKQKPGQILSNYKTNDFFTKRLEKVDTSKKHKFIQATGTDLDWLYQKINT